MNSERWREASLSFWLIKAGTELRKLVISAKSGL